MKKIILIALMCGFATTMGVIFTACKDNDKLIPPKIDDPKVFDTVINLQLCNPDTKFITDIRDLSVNVFEYKIPLDYADTSLRLYISTDGGAKALLFGKGVSGMGSVINEVYICNFPANAINNNDLMEGVSVTLNGKLYAPTFTHDDAGYHEFATLDLSSISIIKNSNGGH